MTAAELLAVLESLEVDIAAREGTLHVNAPKGQLNADLKAAIAAHKTELLELLAARSFESAPVTRVARTGQLPVSFFQERLWVLSKFEPRDTAYNLVTCWPSAGPADVVQVRKVIREIVRRHEMLRAHFQDDAGVPSIALMPAEAVSIELRDVRNSSLHEQKAAIDAAMQEAAHTPFDLASEVPVRFIIFHCAGDSIMTVLAAHHISVDAWSIGLIGQEIAAAYRAASLPALPQIEYIDFAAWQRRLQDRRSIGADLAWWKQQLAGIPAVSSLPPDGPRSSVPAGVSHSFAFSPELTAKVREMVREEGATVYMALLSACAVVLHWYTGQEDIVLGCPMGVRERPEFERIVGPFVNVLALRLGLADDPTFAELLMRARTAVLEAHSHRHVSFERLVEHLKPVRSLDHAPLFQVAVVHHSAGDDANERIDSGGALFDLTWFAREVDGRLMNTLEYRSDVYSAETITSVATRLGIVLSAAVANRDRRLSEMALVTTEESRLVVDEFNATDTRIDPAPFAEQFQRQVLATPAAAALSFEGTTLTYAELNRHANQVAHRLQSLGIGTGVIVGLCMARSLEMVATLIAIQKVGAAYLPLDPEFPLERLSFMLTDSVARALVTNGPAPAGLSVPPGATVVDIAADRVAIAAENAENLAAEIVPTGLAYLIYTSGSTGRPKGVRVQHGALSNFLGAMRRDPGMSPSDRLAAVTTLSFDIAGLELYLPLVVGACVELVGRNEAANGIALAKRLAQSQVTVMQATPATWRMLLESGWRPREGFRALCGGETLPRDLADALLERVAELWNLYGPTETTIWSTAGRVGTGRGAVSIGRPIANTRIYIVDKAGRPRPVGVPGEIWIGGAGVAAGYHGRRDLTAERFVADAFDRKSTGRVYRTGDFARWWPDGRVEHLGRIDDQVKIRGFRIELGEVEAVLSSHPAVVQATAVTREMGPGDLRLVAYVKYGTGEDLTASEVRRHLRRELPEYMIPSVIVALDTVPLTPSGKVDRAALPDPFGSTPRATAAHVTPTHGVEQALAEIWREILAIDTISAEDNFFELGGHSLLSLRVVAAVEKRLGWRMDPRVLFFHSLRQVAADAVTQRRDAPKARNA